MIAALKLLLLPLLPSRETLSKILPWILLVSGVVGSYIAIDHYGYKRAETKYTAEIAAIKASNTIASEKSRNEFLNWKNEKEKQYAQEATEADTAYADLRAKYNANLLRFKTTTSNNLPAGNEGRGQGADAEVGIAQRSDGPSTRPDLYAGQTVTITMGDAQICVDNTARLVTVRKWGLSTLANQLLDSKPLLTSIPTTSGK